MKVTIRRGSVIVGCLLLFFDAEAKVSRIVRQDQYDPEFRNGSPLQAPAGKPSGGPAGRLLASSILSSILYAGCPPTLSDLRAALLKAEGQCQQ